MLATGAVPRVASSTCTFPERKGCVRLIRTIVFEEVHSAIKMFLTLPLTHRERGKESTVSARVRCLRPAISTETKGERQDESGDGKLSGNCCEDVLSLRSGVR